MITRLHVLWQVIPIQTMTVGMRWWWGDKNREPQVWTYIVLLISPSRVISTTSKPTSKTKKLLFYNCLWHDELCYSPPNMIAIVELTNCRNMPSAFEDAHMRKKARYALLVIDQEWKNYHISYQTLEIGTVGHFTSSVRKPSSLLILLYLNLRLRTVLVLSLSKLAISCSKSFASTIISIMDG